MRFGLVHGSRLRTQRDLATVQVAELQARLAEALRQCDSLKAELAQQRRAVETVVDNALFAAGAAPIFNPGHQRFQPRSLEHQQTEAKRAGQPMTAAEWRRHVEDLDRQAAARDRRGQLVEELKAIAQERGAQTQAAQ